MKKLLTLVLLITPLKMFAFCPVCTVGVVAGVGIAKIFGVGVDVVGVWLGATAAIAGNSLYNALKKHNGGEPHFPFERPVIVILTVFLMGLAITWAR